MTSIVSYTYNGQDYEFTIKGKFGTYKDLAVQLSHRIDFKDKGLWVKHEFRNKGGALLNKNVIFLNGNRIETDADINYDIDVLECVLIGLDNTKATITNIKVRYDTVRLNYSYNKIPHTIDLKEESNKQRFIECKNGKIDWLYVYDGSCHHFEKDNRFYVMRCDNGVIRSGWYDYMGDKFVDDLLFDSKNHDLTLNRNVYKFWRFGDGGEIFQEMH